MKENLYSARQRVDPTQVRAFVQITAMASQSEVLDIVAAGMLPGDYVFDMMRHRAILLPKQTVLATVTCPVPDEEPACRIHLLRCNPSEMPLGFEPQNGNKVRSVDQGFVFGSLISSEVALVCTLTEQLDSRQNLRIDLERHQAPR